MNVNEHISYRVARLVHSCICRKARDESRNTIFGWQLRGCNLSKLGDIVAIPIALFALKTLTAQVKDEEVAPVLPTGFTVAREEHKIKPLITGPIGFVGPIIGGGTPTPEGTPPPLIKDAVPFGTGVDVVPFFPETAVDFEPSNGTSDIAKLKDFKYKELEFDAWWLK